MPITQMGDIACFLLIHAPQLVVYMSDTHVDTI